MADRLRCAVRRPRAALRRHRRRRDERPRARGAARSGAEVTGSDRAESPLLRASCAQPGSSPRSATTPPTCPTGAEVVVSTAIPDDNPELAAARAARRDACSTAASCSASCRGMKRTIAVAGTHGKTTTPRWPRTRCAESGREPGLPDRRRAARRRGTNAAWGAGEWVVVEADESDRSFLELGRDVAVITNVELDHHATYANLGELREAFEEFAAPAAVRVLGPGVELRRATGDAVDRSASSDAEHADRSLLGGSRFVVDGRRRSSLQRPRRAQRPQRACRAGRAAARRACRPPRRRRRSPSFTGAGRRFEEHGRTPRGRARLRRLRPPPDRGAGHARGGAHARAARAWSPASSRTSTRARACSPATSARRSRSPTWSSCWTSTGARAARGLPGRERAARGARRRPTRRGTPGLVAARASTTPSGCCRASCASGDVLLTLGRRRRRRAGAGGWPA